jgi:hypothetical protein
LEKDINLLDLPQSNLNNEFLKEIYEYVIKELKKLLLIAALLLIFQKKNNTEQISKTSSLYSWEYSAMVILY